MMDDLLVKYLLQECSEQEAAAVEGWMKASAANRKRYDEFAWLWQESKSIAATSQVNVEEAWNRFVQLRDGSTQGGGGSMEAPVIPIAAGRRRWMGAAAAMVVLLALAMVYKFVLRTEDAPLPIAMLQVQTTDATRSDTLPDGTIVTLNRNSRLQYPAAFADSTRQVQLDGEAFFEVAPNAAQPFIISTGDVQVRVVGTSFNVRSRKGVTKVVVETGIVEVKHKTNKVRLQPKEQVIVRSEDTVLQKQPTTDQLYDYYRSHVFVCDNTPLYTLVQALNEAYDVEIVIGNASLANMRITTTFNNESLDTILLIIEETLGVRFTREKDRIVLE